MIFPNKKMKAMYLLKSSLSEWILGEELYFSTRGWEESDKSPFEYVKLVRWMGWIVTRYEDTT